MFTDVLCSWKIAFGLSHARPVPGATTLYRVCGLFFENPLTAIRSAVEVLPRARDAERRDKLLAVISNDVRRLDRRTDRGQRILQLILTDMFGGTPSNLAISLLETDKVEVIAGVNLPMLIKLAEARSRTDLDSLARMGEDAGKRYIAIASNVLEGAGK